MQTKLVFFGTAEDSRKGLIRGAVAFLLIIVLNFFILNFLETKELKTSALYKTIGLDIIALLLGSAIAVQQNPSSVQESVVYAGLVGLVVYGVYNGIVLSINKNHTISKSIIHTTWGIFSTSLVAIILYYIFWRKQ